MSNHLWVVEIELAVVVYHPWVLDQIIVHQVDGRSFSDMLYYLNIGGGGGGGWFSNFFPGGSGGPFGGGPGGGDTRRRPPPPGFRTDNAFDDASKFDECLAVPV